MSLPLVNPLSHRVKFSLWAVILFVAVAYVWPFWNRDEALRKPTGFLEQPVYRDVPPENNSLTFFEDAVGRRDFDFTGKDWQAGDKILGGQLPWDQGIMQSLLNASRPMKSLMEQALRRQEWYLGPPFHAIGSGESLKPLQRILTAHVMDLAQRGERKEAIQWLSQAETLTMRYLEGTAPYAISGAALKFSGKIGSLVFDKLAAGPATTAELLEMQHILERLRVTRQHFLQHLASVYWGEVEVRADPIFFPSGKTDPLMLLPLCCDERRPPGWWIRARYQPKAEQNLFTEFYTRIGSDAFAEGWASRKALADFGSNLKPMTEFSLASTDPNHTGRVIASGSAVRMLEEEALFFAQEALRRCRWTAVAAKRWALAHGGSWPATLTELVPDYLPEIPLDPYDGNPLRWDQPSGTAYVIGDDGVADLPFILSGKFSLLRKEGAAARLP